MKIQGSCVEKEWRKRKSFVAVSSAREELLRVPFWVRGVASLLIKSWEFSEFSREIKWILCFLVENSGSLEVLLRNSLIIRGAFYWSEVYLVCW